MKLRTVSWVLLAVIGALVLLASLVSAYLAYRGNYPVGGVPIADVAAGRETVLLGLRGVRGTSAAWAAAWAVLFLSIVFGPYRRGDTTCWWGILASALALAAIAAARLLLLPGPGLGAGAPALILGIVVVALLLDVGRLSAPR